ncbi:hypothetical protein [Candidatus Electronema sp. TJ]|uniref:hypothetical protein n=1 Tax=Candidatus Electronema sp. TJ TaxID=3401573 RepID=UPI003AA8C65C
MAIFIGMLSAAGTRADQGERSISGLPDSLHTNPRIRILFEHAFDGIECMHLISTNARI